jgi:hypothetical protein
MIDMTKTASAFEVALVFDLPGRDGLLVSGKPQEGRLWPDMILQDDSGTQRRILHLEFRSPRDLRTDEYTVTLERGANPQHVQPGVLLTTVPETES